MFNQSKIIYTIGHSTKSLEDFIQILQSFHIQLLADIRRFPGSRKFPHFNKDFLSASLKNSGINYIHLEELGGRRKPLVNSQNNAWRNASFRGYADYMQTNEFKKAVEQLEKLAQQQLTCYMCSEAVWWRCHRSMVSDYLKTKGWIVMHIMNKEKAVEHPYTPVAKIIQGNLFYKE
ncbi:MAG: DUF488 domain-containing protein [Chitinophagaceae bacterium]